MSTSFLRVMIRRSAASGRSSFQKEEKAKAALRVRDTSGVVSVDESVRRS